MRIGAQREPAAEVQRVDLHASPLPLPAGDWSAAPDAAVAEAVGPIAEADAVLVGSPVYRASMPATLKNLLDHLPVAALRDKPVGLVVVGAAPQHALGVDRHVRDVLSWFGALPLPTSVYLTNAQFADGVPSPEATEQLDALADALVAVAERLSGTSLGPPPLAAAQAGS
jgi:FMN reductase